MASLSFCLRSDFPAAVSDVLRGRGSFTCRLDCTATALAVLHIHSHSPSPIACPALQLEDAAEARMEAQRLVQQLQEELGSKQAAVARVEKEVAPVLREAQQAEAEVKAASKPMSSTVAPYLAGPN